MQRRQAVEGKRILRCQPGQHLDRGQGQVDASGLFLILGPRHQELPAADGVVGTETGRKASRGQLPLRVR